MAADTGSPSPDRSEDQALIARIQAGAPSAFAELVHRYTRRVYSIGISMLRNEQDARDVVQETFLNVHRRLDTFRGEASLSSWIGRIATNNALMKLRTRRRRPEASLEINVPGQASSERVERVIIDKKPLADKMSLDKELGERIRASVDELPEKYREVLVLADYRELSMRDIADALDITIPNVKTRLHRARLRVRETLAVYLAGRD
jgi:RNA polymerase sigma-70 factor, ECF subfamily